MGAFGDNTSATIDEAQKYHDKLKYTLDRMEDIDKTFTSYIADLMQSYNEQVAEAESCRLQAEEYERKSADLRQRARQIIDEHNHSCYVEEYDYETGENHSYWKDCNHIRESEECNRAANQFDRMAQEKRNQEAVALSNANNAYNQIQQSTNNYKLALNTIEIPQFKLPSDYTNYSKVDCDELIRNISEALTTADNVMRHFIIDNFTGLVESLRPSNSYKGGQNLNVDFSNIITDIDNAKRTIRENINNSSSKAEGLLENYVSKLLEIESENLDQNDYNLMYGYYNKMYSNDPATATQAYLDKLVNSGRTGRILVTCDGFSSESNSFYLDIDRYKDAKVIELYRDQTGGNALLRDVQSYVDMTTGKTVEVDLRTLIHPVVDESYNKNDISVNENVVLDDKSTQIVDNFDLNEYLDTYDGTGRVTLVCDGFPTIGNLCYVDIDEYRRTGVINLYSDKEGGLPIKTNNPDNPYSENLNLLVHFPQSSAEDIYYGTASDIIKGDDVKSSIDNGRTITITLSDNQGNGVGTISLNKDKLDLPKDLYNNAYNDFYNQFADKTKIILSNNDQLSMNDFNKYVKVGDCYIAGHEETRTDENGITQKAFVVDKIDGHEYPAISIEDYNYATNQHNAFVNDVNNQFGYYLDNVYKNDPNALMGLIEDSGYIPKSINDGTNTLYELQQ